MHRQLQQHICSHSQAEDAPKGMSGRHLIEACEAGDLAKVQRYASALHRRNTVVPFIAACRNNRVDVVEWLANNFPWVFDEDHYFQKGQASSSLFLDACIRDRLELAECLLNHNPKFLGVTDYDGNTGMHMAFQSGSVRVAQMLNERDPTLLRRRNDSGCAPFWWACISGACPPEHIIAMYRAFRPDPLERSFDGSGHTILHKMCRLHSGSRSRGIEWAVFVCLVRDLGFPINALSWSGRTPLEEVPERRPWGWGSQISKQLGGRIGVDEVTFRTQWRNLGVACKHDDVAMLKTVQDTMGATWVIGFTVGDRSAILDASKFNSARVATALCEMGADWDSPTPGAAIHTAVEHDSLDVIRVLCNMGANIHARNGKGQTPFEVAKERGSADTEALLREYGAI